MSRIKICYHTPSFSSFARKDIEILESKFRVSSFLFNPSKKWMTPFWFIAQAAFILRNLNCKVHVCQFGGYHSFLPSILSKFFQKKCVIVVGGTDCVSFPEIGYGNFHKPILGTLTCLSYRFASAIVAVDESLIESENTYSNEHSKFQGIKNHCKNLKTEFKVIYNGYSGEFWKKTANTALQGDIISVSAGINEKRRFVLKGIDLLVELAKRNPALKISLVGGTALPRDVEVPSNITLIGACNAEQLRDLFSNHTYYAQLSISEGFPNAICEAMLCGCIPLGSYVAAIPKIIGSEGYILENRSIEDLENLLNKIIPMNKKELNPRQQIINHFTFEKRQMEFLSFIDKLSSNTSI